METLFEEIFEKRQGRIRYGLERVRKAYEKLGFSESLAPSFLIAGTNGKGSTSGFLAKLLSSFGHRVGLFTSPHLCHFRERIQCSHKNVTDELLLGEMASLKESLGELYQDLSFFEVAVLLAFQVFRKEKTTVNVIEVGLGGLLDATNIIEPVATAVVSIGFDHEAILGESLPEIFEQKLGITREGVPLFLGLSEKKQEEQGVSSTLCSFLEGRSVPLFQKERDFFLEGEELSLLVEGKSLKTTLPPSVKLLSPVLRENFCLAYSLFAWYQRKESLLFEPSSLGRLYEGDKFTPSSLLARFQKFSLETENGKTRDVYLDVCHNRESLLESHRTLKEFGILEKYGKIPVFLSILTDKPVFSMIDYVKAFADPLVLFSCSSVRSYDANYLQKDSYGEIPFYESFYEAWKGSNLESSSDAPLLVCGSFFAVGEVLSFIQSSSQKSSVA